MALLLERDEVDHLLDMATAIDVTEAAFAEHGRGQVASHPPVMFRPQKGHFRIVLGALLESKVIGVRLGAAAGFPPGGSTFAAIFHSETAELMALMPYRFGAIRTGATVGLATRLLAREDAEVVGLLGAGRSAMTLLEGTMCVRRVTAVKVYSPNRRNEFAERARSELGLDVRACDAPSEVVRGTDILLVATSSRVPVFDAETMEQGLHIGSMGQPTELDVSVFRRATLTVVGDKNQEIAAGSPRATQPLARLKEESEGFWEQVPELGDVVCGRAGRRGRGDITVFRDSAGGWGDLALANWVLARAKEEGLGREVSL